MEIRAVIVAVLFGGLAGWGLGWKNPDRRPIALAFGLGLVLGLVGLGFDIRPPMAGWSLVLGCPAALVGLGPWLVRGRRTRQQA